jgi:hypothetical protein
LKATQEVSASFKKKRIGSNHKRTISTRYTIEFAQDKCDLINGFKLAVKSIINLRGRVDKQK